MKELIKEVNQVLTTLCIDDISKEKIIHILKKYYEIQILNEKTTGASFKRFLNKFIKKSTEYNNSKTFAFNKNNYQYIVWKGLLAVRKENISPLPECVLKKENTLILALFSDEKIGQNKEYCNIDLISLRKKLKAKKTSEKGKIYIIKIIKKSKEEILLDVDLVITSMDAMNINKGNIFTDQPLSMNYMKSEFTKDIAAICPRKNSQECILVNTYTTEGKE